MRRHSITNQMASLTTHCIEQGYIRNGLPTKNNPIASTGLSPTLHHEAWISFPRKRIA